MSNSDTARERWDRIDKLMQAALDQPAEQRAAYLSQSCAGDSELRSEVESLLAHHEQAWSFLEESPADVAADVLAQHHVRLKEGQAVGRYKTIALLGVGGMGEVYLAEDASLGRQVALKLLPARFTEDADRVKRFEQEARAASALNHPNIVTIHEIGKVEESHFIVTEFIAGQTLRRRMTGTEVKLQDALDIAIQIAGALGAAHTAGIVHRDIKPENIMMRPDGLVKVLDFGLAKLVESPASVVAGDGSETQPHLGIETEMGFVLGTSRYMSPEQARGQKVDPRADIFSLGVVLYEMVTGRAPFDGITRSDVLASILKDEPAPLASHVPKVPSEIEWIERKALAKDRDERYQTIKEMQIDLRRLKQELELRPKLEGLVSAREMALQGNPPGRLRSVPESIAPLARRSLFCRIAYAAVVGIALYAGVMMAPEPIKLEYNQLTYGPGNTAAARFAQNGELAFYTVTNGPSIQTFRMGLNDPNSSRFGPPGAGIQSISETEVALLLGCGLDHGECHPGTLARMPLNGSNVEPKEVERDVWDADFSPDGTKFAITRRGVDMFQLEYPIGNVLFTYAGWLNNVRVSPDGKMVAVILHPKWDDLSGFVRIVDSVRGQKVISESRAWKTIKGLAWSPKGDEVWFSAGEDRAMAVQALSVSSPGRSRLVYEMVGDFKLEDVSSNGSVLGHVGQPYGQIEIADANGEKRSLNAFDWPTAADISSDGKVLLFYEWGFAARGTPRIYTQDLDKATDPKPIGEGKALSLSPDKKWILKFQTIASESSRDGVERLVLQSTGADGESLLPQGRIHKYFYATWYPDGMKILVSGVEEGQHYFRSYSQDLTGGLPTAITDEGDWAALVSSDGRLIVRHSNDEKYYLHTDGREPSLIPLEENSEPIQWTGDGLGLYVRAPGQFATEVCRVEIKSGTKSHCRKIDRAPLGNIGMEAAVGGLKVTPDGESLVYTFWISLNKLYVVKGL